MSLPMVRLVEHHVFELTKQMSGKLLALYAKSRYLKQILKSLDKVDENDNTVNDQ